jgi:hypothetical protein
MKDELEDFIRKNREAFDDREPSDKNWRNIEASLKMQNRGWWNSLTVWRAAAVIFMALSIYLLVPKKPGASHLAEDASMKEFNDVEAFYTQQISQKVDLIDEFQHSEGLNGYTQDFKQLEAMYLVLKEEMKVRPSQKVKDALVLNLLVRIDLLNQQLHKLEKEYRGDAEKNASSI